MDTFGPQQVRGRVTLHPSSSDLLFFRERAGSRSRPRAEGGRGQQESSLLGFLCEPLYRCPPFPPPEYFFLAIGNRVNTFAPVSHSHWQCCQRTRSQTGLTTWDGNTEVRSSHPQVSEVAGIRRKKGAERSTRAVAEPTRGRMDGLSSPSAIEWQGRSASQA